jgi:hypothetical protein
MYGVMRLRMKLYKLHLHEYYYDYQQHPFQPLVQSTQDLIGTLVQVQHLHHALYQIS